MPWLEAENRRGDIARDRRRPAARSATYDARAWASAPRHAGRDADHHAGPARQAAQAARTRRRRCGATSSRSTAITSARSTSRGEFSAATLALVDHLTGRVRPLTPDARTTAIAPRPLRRSPLRSSIAVDAGQPRARSSRSLIRSIAVGQPLEVLADLARGRDVGQRQAHAGDLAGEELGVGLRPLGDAAVVLGLHAVARSWRFWASRISGAA